MSLDALTAAINYDKTKNDGKNFEKIHSLKPYRDFVAQGVPRQGAEENKVSTPLLLTKFMGFAAEKGLHHQEEAKVIGAMLREKNITDSHQVVQAIIECLRGKPY